MQPPTNQTPPKWLGPLFIVVSVLIALYGKPSPGIPHWVAYTACAAFFLGGMAVAAIAFGRPELNNYLGPAIIVCLALVPTWIGFGPGERHCSGTGALSFLGVIIGRTAVVPELECRAVFGGAAVVMWLLLIWGTVWMVRWKRRP